MAKVMGAVGLDAGDIGTVKDSNRKIEVGPLCSVNMKIIDGR